MEKVMSVHADEIIKLNPVKQVPVQYQHACLQPAGEDQEDHHRRRQAAVVLEIEGMDDDAILQVKAMLVLQQTAMVRVAMDGSAGPVRRMRWMVAAGFMLLCAQSVVAGPA
jgi:hypothetical protein